MYSFSFRKSTQYLLAFLIIILIPSFLTTIIITTDFARFSEATNFLPRHLPNVPFSSSNSQSTIQWQVPTIDPKLEHYQRDNQYAKEAWNFPFYRPLVYLYAARPSYLNESETELFLYTQGLIMSDFKRNFTGVGCLVGTHIYPIAYYSTSDIFMCRIPHRIPKGQFLSVVLGNNIYLQQALQKKSMQLNLNLNVTLQDGDIHPVPPDYDFDFRVAIKANFSQLYYVNSIVRYESDDQMLTKAERQEKVRYRVCGCTQQKLYPNLTEPWLDYHRRIGMDFMYIIDNNSTEDLKKKFAKRSDVHVSFWPYAKSQPQIWSYYLVMAQSRCEWMLFFDTDEYVMFGLGRDKEYANKRPLKRFVNRLQESGNVAAQIQYTILIGQHARVPKDPPPLLYLYGKVDQKPHCKTILYMDYPWAYSTVHYANAKEGYFQHYKVLLTKGGMDKKPVDVDEDPILIHYQTRSWEEFIIKSKSLSSATGDAHGLGNPHFIGNPDKPPRWFKRTKHLVRYTHFRSLWKTVTAESDMNEQSLVTRRNGKRCIAVIGTADKKVKRMKCSEVIRKNDER